MLRVLPWLGLILLLCGCISAPSTDPARLPAGEWRLDPDHASVTWQIRHLGLSWYTGRFDDFDATLTFDPDTPESATLTAIVETGSISTGNAPFDSMLRGQTWFDADDHPQIVFESTALEITGENTARLTGQLTLKGRTRDQVMDVRFYGGNFNFLEGRDAVGFSGDMIVDRTEFGIGFLPPGLIGDEVRIHIEAEFLREPDPS